ncbi:MAG: hypothetical protein DRJ31_02065 [Candidatus Methanomethylicota archaeon]|uniref:Winged helix-turn-helix transcription repressor HrcA DNA-binding domain-containing protein n=1 Tax=Thermoproteota archaeon TaxID=2056631 RepID=A0A497EUC8_9CREN|nr:MAG: hypothetical protein DRJ31_02065 [Candidatus Verstraetearchaeota archaeon]RLE53232.1 MAG: hypothetical protein DRJ33_01565 [Candidatus Verstraetearchaeota archaeon]
MKLKVQQQTMLSALVELYENLGRAVKSEELAKVLKRDDGTIRNVMNNLKLLGFVESIQGPKGGYIPTLKALEYFKTKRTEQKTRKVKIYVSNAQCEAELIELRLLDVFDSCKAAIRFSEPTPCIKPDTFIRLNLTPSNIIVEGKVLKKDYIRNEVIIEVSRMICVPTIEVSELVGGIGYRWKC